MLLEKIQHNPKCRVLIEGNNSISIRKLLYQEAIELFIDNPLLGVGSGRFGFSTCGGPGTYPHSTILQAFAELGLIGGVTLISIYILSMLNLLRNSNFLNTNHNLRALFVALLAYFMISDQIYGNYTMAAGTSLIVGLSSATLVRRK